MISKFLNIHPKLLAHLKASGIIVIFFGIFVFQFFLTDEMFIYFYEIIIGALVLLAITLIYYVCYETFYKGNN